jgi:demethylmenaquinone methyltransferase / 2-methoxy-6-polyprenyl-1,4-benzoquinol methylase
MQAPHPPLPAYYRDGDRSEWLRECFDRSAADYDRLERILGLGTGSWYRRRALRAAGLAPGMSVLDIGTGTGLLASAAASIVGDAQLVVGVDPSPGMIGHARVPAGLRLLSGRAEQIPAADSSADFLCMGYALRHVGDLGSAFAEFHRVLRPGAALCILEITLPAGRIRRTLLRTWLHGVMPRIATAVARQRETALLMRYYWDTIAACVPPHTVLAAIAAAGFTGVTRRVELGMFSAYCARRTP